MKATKKRISLISDIHYTTDLTTKEMEKINPDIKVSAAAGKIFDYTQNGDFDFKETVTEKYEL